MEKFLDYFVPAHYDLDITINREKTQFSATAIIEGEAKSSSIKFHAVALDIKQLFIDDQAFFDYQNTDGMVLIPNLRPGKHRLKFSYSAPITASMEGAYLSTYQHAGREERIVATQFESHYARTCFPCIDEPAAKATFRLRLHSDDPDDTLLANLPATNTTTDQNGKTAIFAKTPKMSTYLVAFAVGKFNQFSTISRHGVSINVYSGLHQPVADLKYAGNFAAAVLDFYDDLFKTPYPLPKLDLLALPDFEAGAMENWGLTTYREIALLANSHSSLDQKLYVCLVIAHELSHMWFGDLVTMQWWDDLWLNESFANMIEIYATAKLRPELSAWDDFYTSAVPYALQRDCLPGVQPVKVAVQNVEDIANLFDGAIVYSKGSRLLLMLMRAMGEENFFAGLSAYFKTHAYGNTTANDLWASLRPYADFDVEAFMTPWLVQPGYPVITGDKQRRFLLSGNDFGLKYPIRHQSDDLSGHYLINLSDKELSAKLAHLASLNKEQKLRLLFDRGLLAKTEYATSASLLSLVQAFRDETDPVVWESVSSIIGQLKDFFDLNMPELLQFRHFVGSLAQPAFSRLGLVARPDEAIGDTRLRPLILGLLSYAHDCPFLQTTERQFAPTSPADLDPNLRAALLSALVKNRPTRASEYFALYTKTTDAALKSDLCTALSQTPDRDEALRLLPHLSDGTVRPQDRLGFFIRLARNLYIKDDAIAWLYAHWDWLVKEEGDKTIADYPRYLAGLITRADAAATFRNFFKPHLGEAILSRTLNVAFAEIDAHIALLARDRADLFRQLNLRHTH